MTNITVVIPTYNRADLLPRAINSVLAQSYNNFSLIIVDDGSTDHTEQYLQEFESHNQINIIHQQNKGVSAARNIGIKSSQSDWIAFLDSDDSWHKDKLALQIDALNTNKNSLICHTNETWIRNGNPVKMSKQYIKKGGMIFKDALPLCIISPSSVIIHRTLFAKAGLFDEQLPACEDYDLWLRICAEHNVLYIDQPLITKFGGHDDQLSRKHWGMDRFRIQALLKCIHSNKLNDDDKNSAIEMLITKTNIYLVGARKRNKTDEIAKYEAIIRRYS